MGKRRLSGLQADTRCTTRSTAASRYGGDLDKPRIDGSHETTNVPLHRGLAPRIESFTFGHPLPCPTAVCLAAEASTPVTCSRPPLLGGCSPDAPLPASTRSHPPRLRHTLPGPIPALAPVTHPDSHGASACTPNRACSADLPSRWHWRTRFAFAQLTRSPAAARIVKSFRAP